jgi:hypothetical protein
LRASFAMSKAMYISFLTTLLYHHVSHAAERLIWTRVMLLSCFYLNYCETFLLRISSDLSTPSIPYSV